MQLTQSEIDPEFRPDDFQENKRVRQSLVLVVEDERHIARFLEHVLVKEGYFVKVAHNAEHAYELIENQSPDALLLDVVLPGMSGIDLLRKLRQDSRWSSLVVILLSARWFEPNDPALTEAGATVQCPKPIAPSKLIRKLRECGIPAYLTPPVGSSVSG